MNRPSSIVVVLFLVISTAAVGGTVTEFERAADEWLAAVPYSEAYAFDEFYPAEFAGSGCLLPDDELIATMQLDNGVLTVAASNQVGAAVCAVTQESTPAVSDGNLEPGDTAVVSFEFSPPILALYMYWGSLNDGDVGEMRLLAGESEVAQLVSPESPHGSSATGHGFVSDVPIDRVELRHSGPTDCCDHVMIGAFIGLLEGEPSLGTVFIPGYEGPDGEMVELDFAVTFDIDKLCDADIDNDGMVGIGDFLLVLAQWGPCPPECIGDVDGDGEVGILDFLIVLAEWGPCP